jgi:hypothetical protein
VAIQQQQRMERRLKEVHAGLSVVPLTPLA